MLLNDKNTSNSFPTPSAQMPSLYSAYNAQLNLAALVTSDHIFSYSSLHSLHSSHTSLLTLFSTWQTHSCLRACSLTALFSPLPTIIHGSLSSFKCPLKYYTRTKISYTQHNLLFIFFLSSPCPLLNVCSTKEELSFLITAFSSTLCSV